MRVREPEIRAPSIATNYAVATIPAPRQRRCGAVAAVAAGLGALLLLVLPPWYTAPKVAPECGHYRAASGEDVPRPCGDWRTDERKPVGATARCGDGTWSFSRRPGSPGTCSGHGGVVGR